MRTKLIYQGLVVRHRPHFGVIRDDHGVQYCSGACSRQFFFYGWHTSVADLMIQLLGDVGI